MSLQFFATSKELRKWFAKNHLKEQELWLGYHKVGSGTPSVSWPESVDEAICFGWIDGVRKSIDEQTYVIRFTPRKPGSIWSAINIAKVERLSSEGLMLPEGLAAFEKRKEHKSKIYSYENEEKTLRAAQERQFKANKKVWAWFMNMAPSYRRTAIHWVVSAKQEATRTRRLETLITDSEAGKKIKPLSYDKK